MDFTLSKAAPATLENLRPLLAFARDAGHRAGVGGKRLSHIELALEEILVNVIRYAHDTPGEELRLNCSLDKNVFTVEVRDRGRPFDATAAPPPRLDHPVEERRVGGLGIHFARLHSDEMAYSRQGEENVLTLTYTLEGGT